MEGDSNQRPPAGPLPGTWPTDSFRGEYLNSQQAQTQTMIPIPTISTQSAARDSQQEETGNVTSSSSQDYLGEQSNTGDRSFPSGTTHSLGSTVVPSSGTPEEKVIDATPQSEPLPIISSDSSESDLPREDGHFEPIKTKTNESSRPKISPQTSKEMAEQEMFRVISQRQKSYKGSTMSGAEDEEDQEQIQRLMSRMFGTARQQNSEDEKTRHVGVVFRNVTVRGMGLGAALQPTIGDFFAGPFRSIKGLLTNPRHAAGKPQIRTLLNNFSGCIRPGEMLLVLGRPGYENDLS